MTKPTELSANNAFIGQCLRIDEAMAQLAALRAGHFGVDEEKPRSWPEAASARAIADLLEKAVGLAQRAQAS